MESAPGVDDLQPGPPRGELLVQRDGLSTDLFELPVAERQALMAPHFRLDVPVNRAVQVFGVQIEGEFLPDEERTAPCARVIEPGLSSSVERGVHISIVVHAFREVFHEIWTEVADVAGVVDNQRDVLQLPESPRVDPGVPAKDQRVDPLSLGDIHPFRRGAEVNRPPVETPALREGCRAESIREFVFWPDHDGESQRTVKTASPFAACRNLTAGLRGPRPRANSRRANRVASCHRRSARNRRRPRSLESDPDELTLE